MTTYNKLVRDKIPEHIKSKGGKPRWHIASEVEYQNKLFEKLREEASELADNPSEAEIADILEVIDAIRSLKGFSWDTVNEERKRKAAERGRFEKRVILDQS
jgi:predicted house-cleaning noncanonical NTP pyrophosphatase (MazG superfamily)